MAKRKRCDDLMLLAPAQCVIGKTGSYIVEHIVGSGAFAAVYSARDPKIPGRHVALKEFFPARHPREFETLQSLFDLEREVGEIASPHPLMPTFYEAFTFDGYFYIAQEFIEGSTLDDIIIKRHPLTREWILKWAVSLCDALAFLHSRGVVHHDLKPSNIRITPQGHLALLDFGAAQSFGIDAKAHAVGDVYGTEGYLPPEVDTDGKWVADARTDIFALGCIIYEMIAGIAPDQASINERSMYVTNSLMQRSNADLGLVKLINKALSYNTDYRYATANEFLLDMRQIAPPVLLVSRKHLRWGEVNSREQPDAQEVTLYNAGGGEIRGEIKPRSAWISVTASTFVGNRREVTVSANIAKILPRDEIVTGRLEINTPDQHDQEGSLIHVGDRWFVECSITVKSLEAALEVVKSSSTDNQSIALSARHGAYASASITIRNTGEKAAEFETEVRGLDEIANMTASPSSGTITGGEAQVITVSMPSLKELSKTLTLTIMLDNSPELEIPIVIRELSLVDLVKSLIRIG